MAIGEKERCEVAALSNDADTMAERMYGILTEEPPQKRLINLG